MAIDVDSLLTEVSEETPCGEDLSYEPSFLALEDMLRAKPAGGIVNGVDEAVEEPNWRDVRERSLELLRRSKDLRVAMYLTLALLQIEGIAGLSEGLCLLRGLLERFWDHLHPRLDPEDDNDPLERMNILQALSPAGVTHQDPMKFRQRLMEVPLCHSARMGKFSLRDIHVAKGEIVLDAEAAADAPTAGVIEAAFQDTAVEELRAMDKAVQEAMGHATAVVTAFSERTSEGQAPDLSGLKTVLRDISKCLCEHLAARGYGQPVSEDGTLGNGGSDEVSLSGEIRSADEALLAMEKVCRYFERNEPSSPVPLLLRRARKLVSKSFLEVIEDVCPNAADQVRLISGLREGDSQE